MIKFNDGSILTGYIKSLLHSFNLPKPRIYKGKDLEGKEKEPLVPSREVKGKGTSFTDKSLYIKEGYIKECVKESGSYVFKDVKQLDPQGKVLYTQFPYVYGKGYRDITKNLKINNTIYDSYTHEYLGDYLRFLRDYKKLDLMSLYNCFSNNPATNLSISYSESKDKSGFNFDSKEPGYKIFMVPVKLFRKYTIAIESSAPIELVCGFFGKTQDTRTKLSSFYKDTYMKVGECRFGKPFIYNKLYEIDGAYLESHPAELAINEAELKLFIKIPFNNNSSITILEGDYIGWNDRLHNLQELSKDQKSYSSVIYQNHYINQYKIATTSKKDLVREDFSVFKPITKCQLLEFNSHVSHPFADRLIEYLVDNVINKTEKIDDNIKRLQQLLLARGDIKTDIDNPETNRNMQYKNKSYTKYKNEDFYKNLKPKVGLTNIKYDGIWEDKYQTVIYDVAYQENLLNKNDDVLGYIDKEAETTIIASSIQNGEEKLITIDTDIYGGK